MATTTTLGLTVLAHGENLSANGHAFTSKDPVTVDRLLRQLMDHRHNGGTPAEEPAPDPPTLTETDVEGYLLPDTTYYYRVAELRGDLLIESPASASTWVTTSAGLTAPVITTDDLAVVTTGGTLPPGMYQYAVTVYDTYYTLDSDCPSPVSLMLSPMDGDEQQIEITLPPLPSGADGWNIYRRSPGALTFQLIDTLVGEQVSPFVDDGLPDQSRVLPTRNMSAWKRTVTVEKPAGITGPWVVYRSRDDTDWTGSFLANVDAVETELTDTGLANDFMAPVESFTAYWNPGLVRGDEIVETAQVVELRSSGTAATGSLGEWVCPYTTAHLVAGSAYIAAGTTPVTQSLLASVQQWNGATWDDLFEVEITSAAATGTAAPDPVVELAAGDRLRVNVTQVGDGTDQDLVVQLQLWAHPGWAPAITWDAP